MIEYRSKDYLTHSGGINQDDHNLICGDNELLDARNFSASGGALVKRRGFKQLGQAFTGNLVSVFNYKNDVGASYLLGASDTGEFKALLEAPKKSFTAGETGAGANFEVGKIYKFAITYVDFDLRESPFGEIIEYTPSAAATSIDLSVIPVGPTNILYKKIYRTKGDGGVFYGSTATRIANTTTTYTDNRDDATIGALTSRNPDTIYANTEWNTLYDYHYQEIVLDTTHKTNFTMHKDFAIICNGKDRYKWRAPRLLGVIESNAASGNHNDSVITEATYNSADYNVGDKIAVISLSAGTFSQGNMILQKTDSTRTIKLRWGSVTNGNYIVTKGRVLPYGVTALEAPVVTSSGAGLTGTFSYKLVAGNMNGSLSADAVSNYITISDDQLDIAAIPIDSTGTDFTPAAGTVTIDTASPGGGYCYVEVAGGTFGEVFTVGSRPEIEMAGFTDALNNGKFRIITGGAIDDPTTTKFCIYNAGAVDTTGAPEAVAGLTLYKIGEVTFREIYRTESPGAPPWKFAARFDDAVITVVLADTLADASLDADIYTTTKPQNDYPTLHRHAISLNNRLVIGDLDYTDNPNYSRNGALDIGVGNFDEVEGQYYLNFTPLGSYASSTRIVGLGAMKDDIFAFTDTSNHRISRLLTIDEDDPVIEQLSTIGCLDHRSIKTITRSGGSQSVCFMGKDGLYEIFDNGQVIPMGGKTNHNLRRLFEETLSNMSGKYQDNMPACVDEYESRYIVSLKKDSFTQNDIAIVFDYRDQSFWIWDGFNAADMCFFTDRIVHASNEYSYMEQRRGLNTDYSDNGLAVEAWVESKIYTNEGVSYLKRWSEAVIYSSSQDITQLLSIGARAEFGDYRTNIDLGEAVAPFGYTKRVIDVDTVQLSVTKQTGNTWRYTRIGGAAIDLSKVIVGDRVRPIDSSPFLNENRGDFVVTGTDSSTYFEITNANGYPETTVTMTASDQVIFYYNTGDEGDDLTYLFKNFTLDSSNPCSRIKLAPGTARFFRIRIESFLNNQQAAIAGWTIESGSSPSRGNER